MQYNKRIKPDSTSRSIVFAKQTAQKKRPTCSAVYAKRYMPMIISIEELDDRWKESNSLMALLPLLEYSYPEVLQEIKSSNSITENNLVSMVEYSLRFPSRHWALSAVNWMENGFTINKAICESLIAISKDKADSQKLRHKATAQANKWQRINGI